MPGKNTVQCGACAQNIEITGDGIADYTRFMDHRATCPKRDEQARQLDQLVQEFEQQIATAFVQEFEQQIATALGLSTSDTQAWLTHFGLLGSETEGRISKNNPALVWPDGSPVKTPVGQVAFIQNRIVKAKRPWWKFW